MMNWLAAMKSDPDTPYVPGVMLSWTVIVGNDNTRWHWGSKEGTPEPAIPWCGLMWPDGLPVSYTEAHAIAAHTGTATPSPPPISAAPAGAGAAGALPKQLWKETFLPRSLAELRGGGYGPTYLAVGSSGSSGGGGGVSVVSLNATVPVVDDVLIELTIWPTWANKSTTFNAAAAAAATQQEAVGVLARAAAATTAAAAAASTAAPVGIFAGVTSDGHVILEEWTAAIPSPDPAAADPAAASAAASAAPVTKALGSFDLGTLPSNQEHAAVDGWNMLRLQLRGGEASLWWNPTHADAAGPTRGLRLNVTLPSAAVAAVAQAGGNGLSAAVRGGATARIDYVGVYQA
jgi:hypothetical protein